MTTQQFSFVVDHLGMGGMEKMTLAMAEVLASRGHPVRLISLETEPRVYALHPAIEFHELSTEVVGADLFNQIFQLAAGQTHAASLRVIISHCPGSTLSELLRQHYPHSTYKKSLMVWHWVHGQWFRISGLKKIRYQLVRRLSKGYRRMDDYIGKNGLMAGERLIVCTQQTGEFYQKLHHLKKVQVIYNAINVSQTQQKAAEFAVSQRWQACYMGRLSKDKRVDHIIRAFVKSGLDARLAIIGDGPELPALQQLTQDLHCDRVDFLGWQANPYPYLQQCTLLVMASDSEGLPLVMLEAISLGVPIVCYDIEPGSIKSYLADTPLAVGIIPERSIEHLAKAMHTYSLNPPPITPELLQKISIETMANQFEQLDDGQ